jgi:hypothetical protein
VVALVTLIFGVVGTITVGPAIANGVGEAFQRALCRVTGDGCRALERQACTVHTSGTDAGASVKLAFVRLGRTMGLLRAERSDGTVDVTLLDRVDGGLVATVGASGKLQLGGHELGGSALAQASAVAQLGGGQVWRLPDAAAADRLQRQLVEVLAGRAGSSLPLIGPVLDVAQSVLDVGSGKDLPRPTSRIVSGKAGVTVTFDGPLSSDIKLAARLALGGSRDVAHGGRTIYLAVEGSAGAALLAGLAGLELGGEARLALTLDGGGQPVALAVSGTGRYGASLTKSSDRGGDGLSLARITGRGGSVQASATLDLTDPANAAAASRVLRALSPTGDGDLLAAARALGDAFAAEARVDLAAYGRREKRYGGSLDAGLGPGVGAGLDVTRATTDLIDAWTRPAGGAWEQRIDCLERV